MALLAVLDEPGVDQVRIRKLLPASEISMMRNLSEGFGDGGFFAEGDGTGSISSQLSFLPASGVEISPRPRLHQRGSSQRTHADAQMDLPDDRTWRQT